MHELGAESCSKRLISFLILFMTAIMDRPASWALGWIHGL